jgi:hypothetical protein
MKIKFIILMFLILSGSALFYLSNSPTPKIVKVEKEISVKKK